MTSNKTKIVFQMICQEVRRSPTSQNQCNHCRLGGQLFEWDYKDDYLAENKKLRSISPTLQIPTEYIWQIQAGAKCLLFYASKLWVIYPFNTYNIYAVVKDIRRLSMSTKLHFINPHSSLLIPLSLLSLNMVKQPNFIQVNHHVNTLFPPKENPQSL